MKPLSQRQIVLESVSFMFLLFWYLRFNQTLYIKLSNTFFEVYFCINKIREWYNLFQLHRLQSTWKCKICVHPYVSSEFTEFIHIVFIPGLTVFQLSFLCFVIPLSNLLEYIMKTSQYSTILISCVLLGTNSMLTTDYFY